MWFVLMGAVMELVGVKTVKVVKSPEQQVGAAVEPLQMYFYLTGQSPSEDEVRSGRFSQQQRFTNLMAKDGVVSGSSS